MTMVATPLPCPLRVGVDLVQTSRVAESLATFGDRFLRRVFTEDEVAYAYAADGDLALARLAARFAAKEATVKALDLAETGVGWREIEVTRSPSGAPGIRLHGSARAAAEAGGRAAPLLTVSLSHEGDYATAVVISLRGVS